jgi:uncharacterized repeat protein (TIGR04052 family)
MRHYTIPKTISKHFPVFLLILLLPSCSDESNYNQLHFSPVFANNIIQCQSALTVNGVNWQVEQLQFYINTVEYQQTQGKWLTWPMKTNAYQSSNVALLGDHCETQGKSNANWVIEFASSVEFNKNTKVRFTLGVPYELNHLNPLTQKSPLNDSSMFWVWQSGHKFLRLEMITKNDDWLFHLGSMGCKAQSAMRSPKAPCLYPNTTTFEITMDSSTKINNRIIFDLEKLIKGIKLINSNNCQSNVDNPSCQQLFKNIALPQKAANTKIFTHE